MKKPEFPKPQLISEDFLPNKPMKKPEFPKPQLIREDFLPNEPMKNYRIKKGD